MQLSRSRKMHLHGRKRLGLKACSLRIRAVERAKGKWPPRSAYGIAGGEGVSSELSSLSSSKISACNLFHSISFAPIHCPYPTSFTKHSFSLFLFPWHHGSTLRRHAESCSSSRACLSCWHSCWALCRHTFAQVSRYVPLISALRQSV